MRALYLIRHGRPAFPGDKHMCLGDLDLPLSKKGLATAAESGEYIKKILNRAVVVVSPLTRCQQSASVFTDSFETYKDLKEVSMGLWSGLSFDEIKVKFPEIYEKRGKDPINVPTPEGESLASVLVRGRAELDRILKAHPYKDIVVVAHGGMNRMLLMDLARRETIPDVQGYSTITGMLLEDDCVSYAGFEGMEACNLCDPVPDKKTCYELLREYGTPDHVIAHASAVCDMALELRFVAEQKGYDLDEGMIVAGALLHDIAKGNKSHARVGARYLADKGYISVASIVGDHMVLDEGEEFVINEKTCVSLADKLVKETDRVTLYDRFFKNLPDEKRPFAEEKYKRAVKLYGTFME